MRAKRVVCRLCGARGSVRNKMQINKAGKVYFLCMDDARGIAATVASVPSQAGHYRCPSPVGTVSVPGSGDGEGRRHEVRG